MSVEIAHFYESARKDSPYTHKQQVRIPSLGTYNSLRIPDLLLTALYRLDSKTGVLSENVKLIFQTDGPSDAQLNFKHDALIGRYKHRIYRFDVNMDILFGEGVTNKFGATLGANVGVEKGVKGGVEGGLEASQESPGTRTTLHARIQGMLSANEAKLEAWGDRV